MSSLTVFYSPDKNWRFTVGSTGTITVAKWNGSSFVNANGGPYTPEVMTDLWLGLSTIGLYTA